jgi:TonB family protein
MAVSLLTHVALAVLAVLIANRQPPHAVLEPRRTDLDRLIFLDLPGLSRGGGAGGAAALLPATVMQAPGTDAATSPAPPPSVQLDTAAVPSHVEPPPIARLPIAPTGADVVSRIGAVSPLAGPPSRGPGQGTGADGGRGPGIGDGDGNGVGPGRGGGTGGGVYEVGAGVESPVRLREVKPTYTSGALQAKIQGVVWIEATILASGRVVDPVVVRSLDRLHGLDAQAIQAVLATPFLPGRKDGQPVAVRVTFELTFALR